MCHQLVSEERPESANYYYALAKGYHALLLQALSSFPMFTSASVETAETMLCAVSSL